MLIATSFLVMTVLVTVSSALFAHLRVEGRGRALESWTGRVETIAQARKRAVQAWLAERRSDAEVLSWDPDLIGLCAEGTCPKGQDPEVLRAHLDNLRFFSGFLGAHIFAPDGLTLLSAEGGLPPTSTAGPLARRVARERRYLLHDLHRAEDGTPVIGFLAPVFQSAERSQLPHDSPVLGVVGLYLDPRDTLFPVVAGTGFHEPEVRVYLVRREAGAARILTPAGSPDGSLRDALIPPEADDTAEIAAIESSETAGSFRDHRGDRVLAAVRWISEAGWGLVAAVDEDSALSAWRKEAAAEGALAVAGFLCVVLGGTAAWRGWAGRRYRILLENIRDREERLRALAYGSDDVIFIKDTERRYLLVNPATARLLGVAPEEAQGHRLGEFLGPDVAAVVEANDERVIRGGVPFQGEESLPVGGEMRTFLSARIPIRDAEGKVMGVAGVLRDITDRKRSEEALARWAATLGGLYRVARDLTVGNSRDDAVRVILDGVVEAFWAEGATLHFQEHPGGGLVLADGRNLSAAHRGRFRRMDPASGAVGRLFRTGEVVTVEDCQEPGAAPEPLAEAAGVRALAAVPIRTGGRVFGVLCVGFRKPRNFERHEREALGAVGHMAGVALERASAREALEAEATSRRRAEARLRRLHETTASFTGGALYRQVVRALTLELGARWALLSRLGEDGTAVPLAASDGGELVGLAPFPVAGTPSVECLQGGGGTVHVPNQLRVRFPEDRLARELGADSYLGTPLSDSQGRVVGLLGAYHEGPFRVGEAERDILDLYARRAGAEVERMEAERRLAETRRTLETLVQNLPGAVYRCGYRSSRPIEQVSPGWEAVTGLVSGGGGGDAETCLGSLIIPEDRVRTWREIEQAVAEDRPYELHYRIHDARGDVRWIHDVGRCLPGEGGGMLEGILFDRTQSHSLESQLTHSQRMEALGRLAGGVAHDFNNLLTAISGYAEMLTLRLPKEERSQRAATEIVKAADRAADLTRQLLAFSRRQVVEPRVMDLNESVQGVSRMLERLLGEDVRIRIELAAEACPVRADPSQLEQVVLNLVVNARDAMPSGGDLLLRTCLAPPRRGDGPSGAHEASVVLEVTDSGVGMEPELLEHVFEPFYTTKSEGEGSGLGLATVYGIVQQAGGRVEVSSTPGQGSTFRIHWPRWEGRPESCSPGHPGEEAGSRVTLVLVEDDEAVRAVAEEHLSEMGVRVLSYASPHDALEGLEGVGRIDVLVTDVVLPGMGGPALARQFRERWGGLPVVYVSGHTGDAVMDLEAEGPNTAFLQKPFRLHDLERAVKAALRSREGLGG